MCSEIGDELVLSPVTSLIFMILIDVPSLFLVIVWTGMYAFDCITIFIIDVLSKYFTSVCFSCMTCLKFMRKHSHMPE